MGAALCRSRRRGRNKVILVHRCPPRAGAVITDDELVWAARQHGAPRWRRWRAATKKATFLQLRNRPDIFIAVATTARREVTVSQHLRDYTCAICLSALEGGELALHPCGHHYHKTCLETWLKIQGTCPTCRAVAHGVAEIAAPARGPSQKIPIGTTKDRDAR